MAPPRISRQQLAKILGGDPLEPRKPRRKQRTLQEQEERKARRKRKPRGHCTTVARCPQCGKMHTGSGETMALAFGDFRAKVEACGGGE